MRVAAEHGGLTGPPPHFEKLGGQRTLIGCTVLGQIPVEPVGSEIGQGVFVTVMGLDCG